MTKKVEDIFEEWPTPPGVKELVQKHLSVDFGESDKTVIICIEKDPSAETRVVYLDDVKSAHTIMQLAEMIAATKGPVLSPTGRLPWGSAGFAEIYGAQPIGAVNPFLDEYLGSDWVLKGKDPPDNTQQRRKVPEFIAERNRQHWKRR